jgi:hypothetical protein
MEKNIELVLDSNFFGASNSTIRPLSKTIILLKHRKYFQK